MSALSKASIAMPAKHYTLRHCFEPLILQVASDIRTVQDLFGHANVATTMINTHLLKRCCGKIRSPWIPYAARSYQKRTLVNFRFQPI